MFAERAEDGLSTPVYDDRPRLFEDLAPIYVAFLQLSATRSVGFDRSPIAVADIKAWLDLHGVTELDERCRWFEFIRALDARWLAEAAKRAAERNPERDADA